IDILINELRQFGLAIDWTHDHEITTHAVSIDLPGPAVSQTDIDGWPPSLLAALIVRTRQLTITDLPADHQELAQFCSILQQFGAAVSQSASLSIILDHLHAASIDLGLA